MRGIHFVGIIDRCKDLVGTVHSDTMMLLEQLHTETMKLLEQYTEAMNLLEQYTEAVKLLEQFTLGHLTCRKSTLRPIALLD